MKENENTSKRKTPSAFIKADKTPKLIPPVGGFSKKVERRLRDVQENNERLYPLFFKVYSGQHGITAAVKAKCLDCACFEKDEIRNCQVEICPLWAFRPYQKDDSDDQND